MGIYIKGMEMPTSCYDCNCFIRDSDGSDYCCLLMQDIKDNGKRDDDCPLVHVPPHGRLIEESKVLDIVSEWCPDDDGSVGKVGDLREMLDEIEALPTIIPAEEGE